VTGQFQIAMDRSFLPLLPHRSQRRQNILPTFLLQRFKQLDQPGAIFFQFFVLADEMFGAGEAPPNFKSICLTGYVRDYVI